MPPTHLWPRFLFCSWHIGCFTTSGSTICWQIRKVSRHRLRGDRLKRRFFWGDPTRWRKSWGQFLAWKTIRRNHFLKEKWKKHPGENGKNPWCFCVFFSAWLRLKRETPKHLGELAVHLMDKNMGMIIFRHSFEPSRVPGFSSSVGWLTSWNFSNGGKRPRKNPVGFWNFWRGFPKDGVFFLGVSMFSFFFWADYRLYILPSGIGILWKH